MHAHGGLNGRGTQLASVVVKVSSSSIYSFVIVASNRPENHWGGDQESIGRGAICILSGQATPKLNGGKARELDQRIQSVPLQNLLHGKFQFILGPFSVG